MVHCVWTCWMLLGLLCLAGCGTEHPSTVTGTVTLDDKVLTSGNVTFTPVQEGPVAYGTITGSGGYSLQTGDQRGMRAGEYIATVVATGVPPSDREPPPLLTPAKYSDPGTSDLKYTVSPGKNSINLKLVSP